MTTGLSVATIVVATDFGAESDAAVRFGASLARRLGASVHLVHMAPDPLRAVNTPEVYGIDGRALREEMVSEARKRVDAIAASLPDIRVTTEVRFGSAAEGIIQVALDTKADLIVLGTHGRGGISHLMLGSVAERVIRQVPRAVTTVRVPALVTSDAAVESI